MLRSMTGFGKATGDFENKKTTVEIRSLNSKQFDLNLRMPGIYKEKEIDLRTLLSKAIERGRVDVFITTESLLEEAEYKINSALARSYYKDVKSLAEQTGESSDILAIVMKMPDVLKNEKPQLNDNEWHKLLETFNVAVTAFNQFRDDEGKSLNKEIESRVNSILNFLKQIESFDSSRIDQVKERIKKNLFEFIDKNAIDNNRFEQELIYYIEKLDITEEKVRLKTHCDYFLETMNASSSEGRKLSFITQEIGREINTIGSKANNAEIQKIVVQMKDELEKIKEQINNVL